MKKVLHLMLFCFVVGVGGLHAVVPCTGGSAGGFACDGVDFLAQLPLASMGGGSGNDIWGWTDPVTGTEYALMGRTNGTAFVDLSDPENPVYVGNLPTQTSNSSWRDIKTYADHAFIVADSAGSHGMQVFDLTQLRNVSSPPATFSATAVYTDFGSAHNIVINETSGYAYAVDSGTCSNGLHMIDISTPTSPTFVGCHSADGTIHDAQCVSYLGPDPDHQGAEVCITATLTGDTMDIIDVSNKGATVTLSKNSYPGSSISHQEWFSEDHRFVFHGDEGDETSSGINTRTYIFDVTDLDNPVLAGTYTGPVAAIDHNMIVSGGLLYQANYRSGLRILDIADAANGNLTELGFFDTFSGSNSAAFNGAWGIFPFFASGVLAISDIEEGLILVQQAANACGNGTIDAGEECDGLDLGGATCGDAGCTGGSLSCTASCILDVSGCTGCPSCAADVDFDSGSAAGWTNSAASTCSTGSFVVATPTEVVAGGVTTQVGGDHTSGTGNAFFSATNSAAGTNDVDSGTCIVESPSYPVASASDVSIWYFHGQRDAGDDGGDFFQLEISTDGGASYSALASVGDVTSNAVWSEAVTTVAAGSDVKFRLQVADGPAGGDLIEAGLDDLLICPQISQCTLDADCNDGAFCNGTETCNGGTCQAGTAVDCSDGVSCTDDVCNEGTDSCDNVTNDANCANGLFCDGAEVCNATLGCQAGPAPDCTDGIGCTDDACNEGTDSCDNLTNDANCTDGLFCNGAEVCNATLDCQAGSDPCGVFGCDEVANICLECSVDADCDDGLFCNGTESCNAGSCAAGSDPCPGQSCDEGGDVCSNQNGSQDAIYDAALGAPACAVVGSQCDSLTLLDGRSSLGPEPNQPNTLDTCADGSSGTYHSDESNDRLVVKTLDGADMGEGATVQVDATVFSWSTGTSDHLDLYSAADANNPVWTLITTIDLTTGGLQTLSAQYTLPVGSLQAVRANFRYNGSPSSCSTGGFDDDDDLVFAVGGGAPQCTINADCDNGAFCDGVETCNGGTCQAGADPCPGQSCDEGGDICVAGGGCAVDDDFESGAPDWTNDPASTCSTGDYLVGNPTNPGGGQQIVGSHSGVNSLFTAVNTSAGSADVDGGNCILASPSWAVGGASTLSVWYWHGQRDTGDDAAGDFFRLEYSIDGGSSWTSLVSNGDTASTAVWAEATASITAGSTVELRVQCSDGAGSGDLVECGIDDVSICE